MQNYIESAKTVITNVTEPVTPVMQVTPTITLVYKSAGANVIEIVMDPNSVNNFDRPSVTNREYAKFRISNGTPQRIYNKYTKQQLNECVSDYDKTFKYQIGVPINVPMSEPLNVVSGTGIHVYLTEERAIYDNNDIVNWRQKTWNSSGELLSDSVYIDNKKMGSYKKITIDGVDHDGYTVTTECLECKEESTESFTLDGVKNGLSTVRHRRRCCYEKNNTLSLSNMRKDDVVSFNDITYYRNGKKNGECTQTFDVYIKGDSPLIYYVHCSFDDDILNGEFEEYKMKNIRRFDDIYYFKCNYLNGVKNGSYIKIDDGCKTTGEFINGTGTLQTLQIFDNEKQCIIQIDNYVNDLMDGLSETFYTNKQPHVLTYYKNGLKDGLSETFYTNNRPHKICYYKNGLANGEYKNYYESGNIHIMANYKDNEFDGEYKEYKDESEKYLQIGYYSAGKKNGLWKIWDNETIVDIFDYNYYYYKNNKTHDLDDIFRSNTVKYAEIPYKNGQINGTVTFYYRNDNKNYPTDGFETTTKKFRNGKKQNYVMSLFT